MCLTPLTSCRCVCLFTCCGRRVVISTSTSTDSAPESTSMSSDTQVCHLLLDYRHRCVIHYRRWGEVCWLLFGCLCIEASSMSPRTSTFTNNRGTCTGRLQVTCCVRLSLRCWNHATCCFLLFMHAKSFEFIRAFHCSSWVSQFWLLLLFLCRSSYGPLEALFLTSLSRYAYVCTWAEVTDLF